MNIAMNIFIADQVNRWGEKEGYMRPSKGPQELLQRTKSREMKQRK